MLGLIMVAGMVPGLLIGLQRTTAIDYDAVAYRTAAILTEDPGAPLQWELQSREDVDRIGLAVDKETPNILSKAKVQKFFDNTTFTTLDDYRTRIIFGDYPYRFNISLKNESGYIYPPVGDPIPALGGYGYIKRVVKIKDESYDILDLNGTSCMGTYCTSFLNVTGFNQTFNITMNLNTLLDKGINPAYQYDPRVEPINITMFNFGKTLNLNTTYRNGFYDFPEVANSSTWSDIYNTTPPISATLLRVRFYKNDQPLALPFDYDIFANSTYRFTIDGIAANFTPNRAVQNNLSLIINPGDHLPLDEGTKLDIRFTFHDEYNATSTPRTLISGSHEVKYGSGTTNSTFVQKNLTDAWLEVAVW